MINIIEALSKVDTTWKEEGRFRVWNVYLYHPSNIPLVHWNWRLVYGHSDADIGTVENFTTHWGKELNTMTNSNRLEKLVESEVDRLKFWRQREV